MSEVAKENQERINLTENTCCISTKHAYEKAKERLGWKQKVLDKMMVKAFDKGIKHSDFLLQKL